MNQIFKSFPSSVIMDVCLWRQKGAKNTHLHKDLIPTYCLHKWRNPSLPNRSPINCSLIRSMSALLFSFHFLVIEGHQMVLSTETRIQSNLPNITNSQITPPLNPRSMEEEILQMSISFIKKQKEYPDELWLHGSSAICQQHDKTWTWINQTGIVWCDAESAMTFHPSGSSLLRLILRTSKTRLPQEVPGPGQIKILKDHGIVVPYSVMIQSWCFYWIKIWIPFSQYEIWLVFFSLGTYSWYFSTE